MGEQSTKRQDIPRADPPEEALPASNLYWQGLSGHTYQGMVAGRMAAGNEAYLQQEKLLSAFVAAEQRRLGRPLDLLEFGCGFGRHSWYLSALPGVRYHGYDFSEPMVGPLRKLAPAALMPLSEHLFVGPDVRRAVGGRRFDLLLSVSVLIHNPPERVGTLLREVFPEILKQGGTLCLVENQLVPFSVFENDWHDGCWLHRYLDHLDDRWDVEVHRGKVATHDVYVLRPRAGTRRRWTLHLPDVPPADTSSEALDALGIRKLQGWARAAEMRLSAQGPEAARDEAQETQRVERSHAERRHRLLALGEAMAAVRRELAFPSEPGSTTKVAAAPSFNPPGVELDAPLDTHWAWSDARFEGVLHVFSQEWYGIRAAAGYLPGRKLAVTADRPLLDPDRRLAFEAVVAARIRRVVVHGYSDNMLGLALAMKKVLGPSLRVHVVWHGSTAQFHLPFEIESVERLLQLRRKGRIDGLACVKPGMALLGEEIHGQPIFNVGPRLGAPLRVRPKLGGTVLVPVPDDWMKNFQTNLFAAGTEPRVRRILTIAATPRFYRRRMMARVKQLPRLRRDELFRLLPDVDAVLNATLTECQPMNALEALSHRVPCLTGRLGLGDLDAHPLQRLCQIAEADNASSVRRGLSRLLDAREADPLGLQQMMEDYEVKLQRHALDGYLEWIAP